MDKLHENIYFYIDESYKKEGFLGIAVVVLIGDVNIKITNDMLSSVSKDLLFKHRNKGSGEIHYADNNLGPKINVIDKIYQMPISAYLSYKKQEVTSLSKQEMDKIVYTELLPELLEKVAKKYVKNFKERPITINLQFEQLSDKKGKDLKFFTECISELGFNFNPHVVGKDDIFTALPDYFLGLLGKLIIDTTKDSAKNEMEMVEGKIGLVVNATDSKRQYYARGDEIRMFIKNTPT